MQKMERYLLILSLILGSFTQASLAQSVYAALHGTATDATGAVIPSATVTALNTSTGISTVRQTDKSGYYIFTQLQVGGPYTVTITAPGFQSYASTGLTLNVNDNREVNASLKVGGSAQTVEVAASAVQVETSDTQLKQIATEDQLEEIPLEGRDPAGLQKLQPGVVESSDRIGNFSSNGSQTAQNSYLVNGMDVNDGPLQYEAVQVNPDALAEENIVTSTLNPEFARNSGAVINQIIKSGTNRIHGSGFEFYRDTFLNNGNYFSQIKPVFHQNLYGGTLGGPIFKNKLFLFAAYQGLRNRTAETELQQTLTSDQFSGAFSDNSNYLQGVANNTSFDNTQIGASGTVPCPNIPAKVYSDSLSCNNTPFSVNGFPAGTPWIVAYDNGVSGGAATINVPTGLWNPISTKLIANFVPQANYQGIYYNFNALNTNAQDQGILRADYTPTAHDTIWGSTVFQSSPSFNTLPFGGGSFPGFGQIATLHVKLFSGAWTHTFGSSMLNELRGGYFRYNYPSVIPQQTVQPSTYGFSINPQLSQAGLPYMAVGNYFALGFSFEGPQPRTESNLNFADNFTYVHGNHSFKIGGSFEQFRVHNPFGYLNNGDYSFYGSTNAGGAYSSGDPLIDFTLGIPDTYEQTSDGFIDAVATERYAYFQDNWKASSTVTVNFGVGWDAEQPNQNRQFGGLGIVCWQNSSATSNVFAGGPPGLLYPGDPGCNSAGGPTTHYNRFGPRVGFVWSPESGPEKLFGAAGSHSFSVRAGFGLYYNRDQEEQSLQNLVDPPFLYTSHGAADKSGSPSFANPFNDITGDVGASEPNPFPYIAPKAGAAINWSIYNELGLAAFDPHYSVPYVYNFNLNLQRALPGNMIAQIGYVGSLAHRLASWYEGDPITPAGHAACLADSACSPGAIHLNYPQDTAQPAVVPGTTGTGPGQAPNGIPWYTSIGDQDTEGSSNYNSFQASLIKSPSHGLQFTAAYTYSHALDDFSGYESTTGGDSSYGGAGRVKIYTPGFTWLNYGDSDYDARQRFVTSYVYTVPISGVLKSNLILREALSGWGVGGISAFQTGYPIGISMGSDRSMWCDGYSYFGCGDVPETSSFKIAKQNPRNQPSTQFPGTNQYFDTSSFSAEPIGTYGNTKRNFFHGPGFNYTNFQLSKNLPLSSDGKRYVQLRLEAFNAFNHANFAPPGGNFRNPGTFGLITGVIQSAEPNADPQPARAIQLAGKVYF
jgi:hypothetical protein